MSESRPQESPPSDTYLPYPCTRCGREDRCLLMVSAIGRESGWVWKAEGALCQVCRADLADLIKNFWADRPAKPKPQTGEFKSGSTDPENN